MPWKLVRGICAGGCAIRAPRFPNNKLSQAYSGDRYLTNQVGGVSPDGYEWSQGNAVHAELWALYEAKGRNTNRIKLADIDALPLLSAIRAETDWPRQSMWKNAPLQWFLDTDFGWPVRTPHIQAILDRFEELGLWDSTVYDPGLSYDVEYADDEAKVVIGKDGLEHISIRKQMFHIEYDWTPEQIADSQPACCHRWVPV